MSKIKDTPVYAAVNIYLDLTERVDDEDVRESVCADIRERLIAGNFAHIVTVEESEGDEISVLPHGCDPLDIEDWEIISEFGNDSLEWELIHDIILGVLENEDDVVGETERATESEGI